MPSLLYSVPSEWYELRQRFHYLAEHLAEGNDLTVLAPRSHKRLVSERRWGELLRPWSVAPLRPAGKVCSVSTVPFYRRHPALVRWQWRTQARRVALAAHREAPTCDVLWMADPTLPDLPDLVSHRFLIYECVDDHAGFWADPDLSGRVSAMEERIARRADLVIASSRSLARRLSTWNERVVVVNNGSDLEHFAAVGERPETFPLPPELVGLAGPKVGYYGALGDWVDLELLRRTATEHPEWHMVLIGPAFADVSALQALPNVHLLGPKPYEALRAYLAHLPVWVVPFKVNDLTLAVDPLKAYEYLAAGRRVVSTWLPELEHVGAHLRIARTPEDWIAAVEGELAAGPLDPSERQERARALAARDWRALAGRIEGLITDALSGSLERVA